MIAQTTADLRGTKGFKDSFRAAERDHFQHSSSVITVEDSAIIVVHTEIIKKNGRIKTQHER